MIKVKIVGASGYGGIGVTEIIHGHPEAEIVALISRDDVGTPISDVYPHLKGFVDMKICAVDSPEALVEADVVFMATPDQVGMKLAPDEIAKGSKVIDYSGDFRFNTKEAYAEYARRIGLNTTHASPELMEHSVYGLSELHRRELNTSTSIVGNPGCFAVSCILGLSPAVKSGILDPAFIVCDCKTGVSGAGKKPSPTFHYPARYDHMNAYKLAGHQHVCEIERELSLLAGSDIKITFTSHVVPVCRGIMSTLYGALKKDMSEEEVIAIYREFFKNDAFIRVFNSTAPIGSPHVRGSNYCNLVVSVDRRTQRLRVVAYIDNLMKGQAGSAVQNMNLICGLPETMGLDRPGMFP
jgi:N-acetyl-gamma-glutamyl-phosphate reductase